MTTTNDDEVKMKSNYINSIKIELKNQIKIMNNEVKEQNERIEKEIMETKEIPIVIMKLIMEYNDYNYNQSISGSNNKQQYEYVFEIDDKKDGLYVRYEEEAKRMYLYDDKMRKKIIRKLNFVK